MTTPPCPSCEERTKIIKEAWEAIQTGDFETYKTKLHDLFNSALNDVFAKVRLPTVEERTTTHAKLVEQIRADNAAKRKARRP